MCNTVPQHCGKIPRRSRGPAFSFAPPEAHFDPQNEFEKKTFFARFGKTFFWSSEKNPIEVRKKNRDFFEPRPTSLRLGPKKYLCMPGSKKTVSEVRNETTEVRNETSGAVTLRSFPRNRSAVERDREREREMGRSGPWAVGSLGCRVLGCHWCLPRGSVRY